MTEQETRGLWIVEDPYDELERDLDQWCEAVQELKGLSHSLASKDGTDAAFMAVTDATVRAKRHVERLQEKARHPEPEDPGSAAPDVLTAVNRLLSEAAELLLPVEPTR